MAVGLSEGPSFPGHSPFICAVATIICNSCGSYYRNARRVVVNELLYADDLVLMSETMEDLKERFCNWKDVLKSKGLRVGTRKQKVMVSGLEGEIFRSKIDPCGVLWEESHGQFSVVHKMYKLCSQQMCKNKESNC